MKLTAEDLLKAVLDKTVSLQEARMLYKEIGAFDFQKPTYATRPVDIPGLDDAVMTYLGVGNAKGGGYSAKTNPDADIDVLEDNIELFSGMDDEVALKAIKRALKKYGWTPELEF